MNKLTKEQCLEAFNHILHCDRDTCSNISDAYRNDLSTLRTLINEHFDNTLDFKHFKLHSKSYLKTLKKDELIDYIYMVYHNWENDNFGFNNVMKYATELLNKINAYEEIIKKHGLENLTLHELDCAFKKMLGYVQENNRLMNLLSQQNEIIKEYQNGEAYKELKRSYDELLGHAVAFQEELINLKDNPPLKFEELHENMWVWDNKYKHYIKIRMVKKKNSFIGYYPNFECDPITDEPYENLQGVFFFEENRFFSREVKE